MNGRVRRLVLAGGLAFAIVGMLVVLRQSGNARLAADFTIDYSAGTLVRQGQPGAVYDQPALVAMEHQVVPATRIDPRLPFNKPLAAVLPYALLSVLPIEMAFRLWQLLGLGLMLASIVVLQRALPMGRRAVPVGVLALLAAVPTWASLTEGQETPLLLLGSGLILFAAARPGPAAFAGAVGGLLLAVKPQYLPAYLLILVAVRHGHALIAASLAAGAVLLSPLLGGQGAFAGMVHNALLANQVVSVHADESWIGLLATMLPSTVASVFGIALSLCSLGLLAVMAWRRAMEPVRFAALAGILAVLASPHALPHDLLLLAVPAWLAVALYRRAAMPFDPLPVLVLVNLAAVVDLRGFVVPLTPLVITLALGWTVWQLRPQPRQERPPLPLAG